MPNAHKKDDPSDKENLGKQAQDRVRKAWDYAGHLHNDTIAYIVLAVGLFLFFISPIFGGAIVGVVVGITFVDQITDSIKAARNYFQFGPLNRTIVLLTLLVVLIYALPTLFLGALAAVGVLALTNGDAKKKRPK